MTKRAEELERWADRASKLVYEFELAVEYNQRGDEFAAAWGMAKLLKEISTDLPSWRWSAGEDFDAGGNDAVSEGLSNWWVEKTKGGYGVIKTDPPLIKETVLRPKNLMPQNEDLLPGEG